MDELGIFKTKKLLYLLLTVGVIIFVVFIVILLSSFALSNGDKGIQLFAGTEEKNTENLIEKINGKLQE